ncbi:hypothetical protein BC829DRAFT_420597 [Chytridium lagenaria]|nr:hypothetical protein BC829DRAFT_420597 [Chytridium lagenaria]
MFSLASKSIRKAFIVGVPKIIGRGQAATILKVKVLRMRGVISPGDTLSEHCPRRGCRPPIPFEKRLFEKGVIFILILVLKLEEETFSNKITVRAAVKQRIGDACVLNAAGYLSDARNIFNDDIVSLTRHFACLLRRSVNNGINVNICFTTFVHKRDFGQISLNFLRDVCEKDISFHFSYHPRFFEELL